MTFSRKSVNLQYLSSVIVPRSPEKVKAPGISAGYKSWTLLGDKSERSGHTILNCASCQTLVQAFPGGVYVRRHPPTSNKFVVPQGAPHSLVTSQ